jgi:two-component system CheB/CheR fusion protein
MVTDKSGGLDPTAWLAAIVESSDDAIISEDLNGVVTSWNLGAERIFGYPAHEIIGQPVLKLIPPERRSEEDTILDQVRRGESIKQHDTQRLCKDGRLIHVSLTESPIRNQDNIIVGVSKIARDITERKLAQETQTLLLRGLNHRSKNLLAVADAIVRQTARSTSPKEFVDRISRRLHALSINQDLMIEHDWRGADIRQIIQWQLASVIDDQANRVTLDGYPCVVTPRVAQALGLAIYELATNALKYGALSSPAGRVHIKWQVEARNGTREFKLSWHETGGPAAVRPRKKGFGSAIIEDMIARSVLGSVTVAYPPTGLVWELVAPESGLTQAAGSPLVS